MVKSESRLEYQMCEALERLSTALDKLRDLLEDHMDADVSVLRLSREGRVQLLEKAQADYLYYWHYARTFTQEYSG